MRGYGQFCPVAKAAELFCERWTPLILRDLAFGAMIYLWRGDLSLAHAIHQERLEVLGAGWARRALPRWLCSGPLARVKSQRIDARAA